MSLLTINNLTVRYPTRFGDFIAVEDINLTIEQGEIHGLVGESGAGKSTIGAVVMGLLESPGEITSGSVNMQGTDLTKLSQQEYHKRRGSEIGMIFQDPQTSLNPLFTISDQLVTTIMQHNDVSADDAREQAIALLEEVGINDAAGRIDDYPHMFSGGMRQRVVIALVLCTNPKLIVADEPTTALDVSIQKRILILLKQLAAQRGVGILLITHDIGVIAEVCDRVTVLRKGRVMEEGVTNQVIGQPQHEYTIALMAAVPLIGKRLDRFQNILAEDNSDDDKYTWQVAGASAQYAEKWLHDNYSKLQAQTAEADQQSSEAILAVQELAVRYPPENPGWFFKKQGYQALSGINFSLHKGDVLGVVGESGSGKSTLAKAIVGLVDYTQGSITSNGIVLEPGSKRSRSNAARRRLQMIFQDPYSSLNNRRTVEQILSEPLKFYSLVDSKADRRKLVASVLELVDMPQQTLRRYPHQFSGGQRQRIAIARSLLCLPDLLICDEPTSALDVSIQAHVLNLLKDLQSEFNMAILFISHNLAVVRQMADRVVVLKDGEMVEQADSEVFFESPQAEYSKLLLSETPSLAILN